MGEKGHHLGTSNSRLGPRATVILESEEEQGGEDPEDRRSRITETPEGRPPGEVDSVGSFETWGCCCSLLPHA